MSEKDQDASRVLDHHLRAEQLRLVAEAVKDPGCHASLMRLVGHYEAMARGAENALTRALAGSAAQAPACRP